MATTTISIEELEKTALTCERLKSDLDEKNKETWKKTREGLRILANGGLEIIIWC